MKQQNYFRTEEFLQYYGIPYTATSGINTDAYFAVTCYKCGGEHKLGVSRDHLFGNCWVCGYQNSKNLVYGLTGETDVAGIIKRFGGKPSDISYGGFSELGTKRPTKIIVPGKKDITPKHKAWKYIEGERKFDPLLLFSKYDLRYTTYEAGVYNYRVVFPVYYNNRIVSYQCRDYTGQVPKQKRFMACRKDDEIINHQHILYNLDNCNSDSICVVEGLFDCIRMCEYGGNVASCFGISTTIEQAQLLQSKYKRIFLLFDTELEAQEAAEKFAYQIGSGRAEVEIISIGEEGVDPDLYFKDNGEELLYFKKELGLL